MTHLLFATRGIRASMQQMKEDLSSQRWWWRRKNLTTNKVEHVPVQGILRPIELWEYVYPKESPTEIGKEDSKMEDNTDIIMRSLGLTGSEHYIPKSIGKYVRWICKFLGLKKVPDTPKEGNLRWIHQLGISVIPIGVKEDEYKEYDFGPAGKYEQEGL